MRISTSAYVKPSFESQWKSRCSVTAVTARHLAASAASENRLLLPLANLHLYEARSQDSCQSNHQLLTVGHHGDRVWMKGKWQDLGNEIDLLVTVHVSTHAVIQRHVIVLCTAAFSHRKRVSCQFNLFLYFIFFMLFQKRMKQLLFYFWLNYSRYFTTLQVCISIHY